MVMNARAETIKAVARAEAGALSLVFRANPVPNPSSTLGGGYLTGVVQKGVVPALDGRELDEEGVGFGVPLIKRGPKTILPGSASLSVLKSGQGEIWTVEYDLNLLLRAGFGDRRSIDWPGFYWFQEGFSWLHRRYPRARGAVTRGSGLLRAFGYQPRLEVIPGAGVVRAVYTFPGSLETIHVDMSFRGVKGEGAQLVVASELGARFSRYRDSSGLHLEGSAIGTWDKVRADEASFISPADGLAFTLGQAGGAEMYRGRELSAGSLAWAGLAYVLDAGADSLSCNIRLGIPR